MTAFNYSRWIAKEVTGPKNIDKKIFVVGPAGSGKSMTGLALAEAVSKWISYYNHKDMAHAGEYFAFDQDHIAVIDTTDLIHVMTTPLKNNSIKIIDDCGASIGFTNRRSMSRENLDLASIYGTNRVRNGVTIYCVQDINFTDLRMKKLANEIIDLTDFYQRGPFRIARLWRIRMNGENRKGITKCRFMTYERGQWVTQESIAVFLPTDELRLKYEALRVEKEAANANMIRDKYTRLVEKTTQVENKERCPKCNSPRLYKGKKTSHKTCRECGHVVEN